MAYKSILTIVTGGDTLAATLAGAARIARAHDAHLDILILGVDHTQPTYSMLGGGEVFVQPALDRAANAARAAEKQVNAALATEAPGLRVATETAVLHLASLVDVVTQRARFADLVVLPRPYGPTHGIEAEVILESALFQAQAPVLVLPETHNGPETPQSIVIAWNQSPEALAAVRRAMPLLLAAEQVDIAVIDPPAHGPERSDPGGLLCQMLVRLGVRAQISVLAKTQARIADILAQHCQDRNADLMVMGAYGHSRLREAILGGATRHVLQDATLPVLMAH